MRPLAENTENTRAPFPSPDCVHSRKVVSRYGTENSIDMHRVPAGVLYGGAPFQNTRVPQTLLFHKQLFLCLRGAPRHARPSGSRPLRSRAAPLAHQRRCYPSPSSCLLQNTKAGSARVADACHTWSDSKPNDRIVCSGSEKQLRTCSASHAQNDLAPPFRTRRVNVAVPCAEPKEHVVEPGTKYKNNKKKLLRRQRRAGGYGLTAAGRRSVPTLFVCRMPNS